MGVAVAEILFVIIAIHCVNTSCINKICASLNIIFIFALIVVLVFISISMLISLFMFTMILLYIIVIGCVRVFCVFWIRAILIS